MKIVYKNPDHSVSILTASDEAIRLYSIEIIALKDVPAGLPYWIVDDDSIPSDRTFRAAWEIPEEWEEPDGFGSEFNTFEEIKDACNKPE